MKQSDMKYIRHYNMLLCTCSFGIGLGINIYPGDQDQGKEAALSAHVITPGIQHLDQKVSQLYVIADSAVFKSTSNREPVVNRSMFKYLQPHPVRNLNSEMLLDLHVVIGRLGLV